MLRRLRELKGEIPPDILTTNPRISHRFLVVIFGVLLLLGVIAFLTALSGPQAPRAWQVYLVNLLFWFGLSSGAMLFVAILNVTNARWGRPLKRLVEALGAFLPFSFLLFWVLYFGREEIFPWVLEPVHGKENWLNLPFLFVRDGVGLFLLTVSSLALSYYSTKKEKAILSKAVRYSGNEQQGSGKEGEPDRCWRLQVVLSPIVGILYGLVLTLVAFDLIMSLDPHWFSTLFGGYFFIGSFYTALAALVCLTGLSWKVMGLEKFIRPRHFHDLGKLLFAFCLMTGYLFYSQFLVIWYGNIHEETKYIIHRIHQSPWEPLAWIILGICFALPFCILLSRKIKMRPTAMVALGAIILAGMWLERFILIAPSLWKGHGIPLGMIEVLITGGFFGAMALTSLIYLKTFPLLPFLDPLFQAELKVIRAEVEPENTRNK